MRFGKAMHPNDSGPMRQAPYRSCATPLGCRPKPATSIFTVANWSSGASGFEAGVAMVVVERHGQQAARSMAAGKFVQVTCNSNAEGNPIGDVLEGPRLSLFSIYQVS